MFDFAWSEIGLIAVVALIFIGPKDLPVAIKAVSGMIKKARKMASEFQTHVDEMVKDADLGEVRDQIKQIRNFDLRGVVERHVDGDGSLRRTLNENPMATDWSGATSSVAAADTATIERTDVGPGADADALPPKPEPPAAPDFVPPGTRVPYSLGNAYAKPAPAAPPPAFIPPRRSRY